MTPAEKITELLQSEKGRSLLMEVVPQVSAIADRAYREKMDVPVSRIAWCTDHRANGLPADVVDTLKNRVDLNRVVIDGQELYIAQEGNHRTERFAERSKATIPALVTDFDVMPGQIRLDPTGKLMLSVPGKKRSILCPPENAVTQKEADALRALGLATDAPTLAPPPPPQRSKVLSKLGLAQKPELKARRGLRGLLDLGR